MLPPKLVPPEIVFPLGSEYVTLVTGRLKVPPEAPEAMVSWAVKRVPALMVLSLSPKTMKRQSEPLFLKTVEPLLPALVIILPAVTLPVLSEEGKVTSNWRPATEDPPGSNVKER